MQQCCATYKAKFLVYAHPSLAETWDPYIREIRRANGLAPNQYDRHALERRLQNIVSTAGIDFCPLIDNFVRQQDGGPFHLLPKDFHCNGKGYEVTAAALADRLRQGGYLSRGQ
jgi:hypothetical protein